MALQQIRDASLPTRAAVADAAIFAAVTPIGPAAVFESLMFSMAARFSLMLIHALRHYFLPRSCPPLPCFR